MSTIDAFPQYPTCRFCDDAGLTFDGFNGFRFCACPAGQRRAEMEPTAASDANETRAKIGAV